MTLSRGRTAEPNCTSTQKQSFCGIYIFCYASSALPRPTLGRRTFPADEQGGHRASTNDAWLRFGRVAGYGANGAGAGFLGRRGERERQSRTEEDLFNQGQGAVRNRSAKSGDGTKCAYRR